MLVKFFPERLIAVRVGYEYTPGLRHGGFRLVMLSFR